MYVLYTLLPTQCTPYDEYIIKLLYPLYRIIKKKKTNKVFTRLLIYLMLLFSSLDFSTNSMATFFKMFGIKVVFGGFFSCFCTYKDMLKNTPKSILIATTVKSRVIKFVKSE